jgi:hypothetical protein
LRIRHAQSNVLDLFLAVQREVSGRDSWESSLLPRPLLPELDGFRRGLEAWAPFTRNNIPDWLVRASEPTELLQQCVAPELRPGVLDVVRALVAARHHVEPALREQSEARLRAVASVDEVLRSAGCAERLHGALGTEPQDAAEMDIYVVPFAPHPPAVGFLAGGGRLTGLFADCRRFVGSTLAESVLTLLSWAQLRQNRGPKHLSVELATRLPGSTPYQRRLRVLLTKILIELTAGHLMSSAVAEHRPCVEILGTRWRYPRIYAVADGHWTRFLEGDATRENALAAIADDLGSQSPRWFADHVDPSAIAADFYLLEWMAAAGNDEAARELAQWLPQLCSDLAGRLDAVIGNELGHYERSRPEQHPPKLADFLRRLGQGDSRAS